MHQRLGERPRVARTGCRDDALVAHDVLLDVECPATLELVLGPRLAVDGRPYAAQQARPCQRGGRKTDGADRRFVAARDAQQRVQRVVIPQIRRCAAPAHECNDRIPVRVDGREDEIGLHLGAEHPSGDVGHRRGDLDDGAFGFEESLWLKQLLITKVGRGDDHQDVTPLQACGHIGRSKRSATTAERAAVAGLA